jgi:hypothetical protein
MGYYCKDCGGERAPGIAYDDRCDRAWVCFPCHPLIEETVPGEMPDWIEERDEDFKKTKG